jgi:hypothetical protein
MALSGCGAPSHAHNTPMHTSLHATVTVNTIFHFRTNAIHFLRTCTGKRMVWPDKWGVHKPFCALCAREALA